MCRLCWGDEDDGPLVQPCACRGSIQWIHEHCLEQWRRTAPREDAAFRCGQCMDEYRDSLSIELLSARLQAERTSGQANSDANFTDAAEDRKDAFAKLVLLEEMMRRQEERMENMEERMGRQEEKMGRLLRHFGIADQPSHSFDDGKDGVLVLQVKLPGLSSMSGVELDVSADGFALSSPLFALELAWPRAVDADGAKAKFLRKSGVLQVTLPLN